MVTQKKFDAVCHEFREEFDALKKQITDLKPQTKSFPEGTTHVVNTYRGTFHTPTCKKLPYIFDEHTMAVNWDRETCLANGLTPCKICNS